MKNAEGKSSQLATLETSYAGLDRLTKVAVTLTVMHELTLLARAAYIDNPTPDGIRLAEINEVQHRLVQLASDVLGGRHEWSAKDVVEFLSAALTELKSPRSLESLLMLGK